MARDERPLWERVCEAADTVSELLLEPLPLGGGRSGVFWDDLPGALHDTANQLQRQAEEAAERDQLIDDVAAFLYRSFIGGYQGGDSMPLLPEWSTLPPGNLARVKYRTIAAELAGAFEIQQVEAPF